MTHLPLQNSLLWTLYVALKYCLFSRDQRPAQRNGLCTMLVKSFSLASFACTHGAFWKTFDHVSATDISYTLCTFLLCEMRAHQNLLFVVIHISAPRGSRTCQKLTVLLSISYLGTILTVASDSEITIRTVHHLLNVKAYSVRSFWRHNFMLDQKKPSLAAYVDMLKEDDKLPGKENHFTMNALRFTKP